MTTDLVCFDDITLMGDETSEPLTQLEQDLYHVTIENHGENTDDPDRGFALDEKLSTSAGVSDQSLVSMQHELAAEWEHDPRVAHAAATITNTGGSGNGPREYTIQMSCDTDAGHLASSFTSPTGATVGGGP